MTLSEARDPTYSGTTSGEWSAPSLNEYINAFATEADQDASSVSDLSQESRNNIAARTLIGDPEADTEDDLIAFPVVATSNSLHEGALDAALSRAPQANLSESTITSIQTRARSLLEEEFDRDLDGESSNADVISLPSVTARLDEHELEDSDGPYTVHGVALGEDELTRDPDRGMLLWPADTLRTAASTLEGQPVTVDHPATEDGRIDYPPSIEDTAGRVTAAGYEEGVGVVFEATLSERDIAEKIDAGILDVSPDIAHSTEGTDPDTGAWRVSNARFLQLGIVSKGAGPQNSVQLGPSRALASLSATDIQTMLNDQNHGQQEQEARLQEDEDPAEAPDPNVDDAVRWHSEAGGEREPDDWRYGIVVNGLEADEYPDDEVLVAVYQPDEDYEEWEPRPSGDGSTNERHQMKKDSLIPIGSNGKASLPPISQVRNADADPRDGEDEADGAEADESADAAADQNGGENVPEGDDARPNDTATKQTATGQAATEQSTPAGEASGSTDADTTTPTDSMSDEESQNAEADAEAAQAQEQNDAGGANEAAGEDEQAQVQEQNQNANRTAEANEENRQADSSQSDKLKTRLADLHEQNNDLQQENEQLRQEVSRLESLAEGAGKAYANALFDDDGPVTPEEALDLMSVEQLRQKYEETPDASLVDEDDTPDVQGGDEAPAAAPSEHSASATASLSDSDQEEISRLEESIEEAKRMDLGGAVRHYESRLADLRGAEGGD